MTTHLIKIPFFTHASHVTKFSMFILRRRQRSLEFRLVCPDNKALGAFLWICHSFADSIGSLSYTAEREPRVDAILEVTVKH